MRLFHRFITTHSKAIVYENVGKPDQVLRLKQLELKMDSDSVLLEILAAPINPSDMNMIQGIHHN
jgi:trans-2-enoyl-CoA reductase